MRPELLTMVLLLGMWATAGCTSPRCKTDSDCFVPEVCVERRCESPTIMLVDEDMRTMPTPDADASEDAGRDVSGPADVGGAPDDMSEALDFGTDVGGEDMGMPDQSFGSCVIDPFTFMCDDDEFEPNNISVDGAVLSTETYGCPVNDFKPFQTTIEGTMCPIDGTDWFRFNFADCDDAAFIIELQVELLSDCDPEIVGVDTRPFDCADDFVDCTIEDGKPTLRAIIDRTNLQLIRSAYVEVSHKMQQDVTFDYRLSVEVRR